MEEMRWSPTCVVGIDFGMTCTGVAYSSSPEWARPEVLKEWPDFEKKSRDKWPSRVAYDIPGQPVDWGLCNWTREKVNIEREFKLFLDPTFQDDSDDAPSHEEAVRNYKDYMRNLHDYLEWILPKRVWNFTRRQVEYTFSIPTTWKDPRLSARLKDWLWDAGFVDTVNRRVVFSQTEAEAAAVHAATNYEQGNIIMVVDAGGATTDINILEIVKKTGTITKMLALDKAEGINIGSVRIDEQVRDVIEHKLRALRIRANDDLRWLAEDMMDYSGFERYKCNFDGGDIPIDHYLKIPERPNSGVAERHVVLESVRMNDIFEPIILELITCIKDKIAALQLSRPQDHLRLIVLSGGLGSSKYIETRLTAEFCGYSRLPNAPRLEILAASEPQLAVVKGLVMNRSQALQHGQAIYTGRCSRISYGILIKQQYDEQKHVGEPFVKDRTTGEKWVENQIDWLIKEGEVVPETGLLRPYTLRRSRDQKLAPFHARVVMSDLPKRNLPHSKRPGLVTEICTITGKFDRSDFADFEHVKRLFRKDKGYHIADFKLKVIVGSTDLGFEFVSMTGRKFSPGPERIQVDWQAAVPQPPSSSAQTTTYLSDFYGRDGRS